MAEAALVAAIQRELTKRRAYHFNIHRDGAGRNGLPDIFAIYKGRPLVIEAKTPTGQLTPLQEYELGRARRAGATTVVARHVDDVRHALDQIDKPTPAKDTGPAARLRATKEAA